MKDINPFVIGHYVSPAYFCNRQTETEKIINGLENQRNISLISHRRYGKTDLIFHLFQKLKKKKGMKVFYVDLLYTQSIKDFNINLAKAIIGKFETKTARIINSFSQIVKSLRPVVSFDPLTGQPSVEITYFNNHSSEVTLKEIFDYLGMQKEQIVIALDEFQQIVNYEDDNTEALLRSHIQQIDNTNFIFSGSQKHLLTQIFSDYSRPFYQSTEFLFLEKIPEKDYRIFIKRQFKKHSILIEDMAIDLILDSTNNHTFFVQFLCNRLFSKNIKTINEEIVMLTLNEIIKENEPIYYSFVKLLTKPQFKLITAIAKEGGISKPTSNRLVEKYKLPAPSSVKAALKSLVEKEMIYYEKDTYYVYDAFYAKHLEKI